MVEGPVQMQAMCVSLLCVLPFHCHPRMPFPLLKAMKEPPSAVDHAYHGYDFTNE